MFEGHPRTNIGPAAKQAGERGGMPAGGILESEVRVGRGPKVISYTNSQVHTLTCALVTK
jgi:hypothetical protein